MLSLILVTACTKTSEANPTPVKKGVSTTRDEKTGIRKKITVLSHGMLVANEIGHSAGKKPKKNHINI